MPNLQALAAVPSFGSQLGQALGGGISQGISANLQNMLEQKKIQGLESDLIARGYPEQLARLAATATTGGQTEVLKTVLDQLNRGMTSEPGRMEGEEETEPSADVGLTPKERIARQSERFKAQLPKYQELEAKSFENQQELSRIQRLRELNDTGNLPAGLGRINVDFKNGELRAPFLASEDSQEFVKIVNDFLSGAKNTFGARVTNFEVDRFMRRLPSLLNTKAGRSAVLKQMSIFNEINRLHNEGVLGAVEKAGGIRNIDLDQAERVSRKKNKEEIDRLRRDYAQGSQFINSISKKPEEISSLPGSVLMKDPSGVLRQVPKNQAKEAQEAGYKLER
jgi:hypothetical protein